MATVNIGSLKFNWKGAYNGSTAYAIDDVTEYNGSSYICILASTGNLPTNTTYFQPMATKGTDGTDVGTTLTTQGDILYRDGSGLQRLAAGTNGQLLQTGGSGANPNWTNAPVGISGADMWRMTTNTGTTAKDPVDNLERIDDATFAKIGTGMSESSGIFTFPETGLWWVRFNYDGDSSNVGGNMRIWASSDSGSSYDRLTDPHVGDGQGWYVGASTEAFVNVTNASTFRVKFEKTASWNMYGSTNENRTCMTFVRLGDSQ